MVPLVDVCGILKLSGATIVPAAPSLSQERGLALLSRASLIAGFVIHGFHNTVRAGLAVIPSIIEVRSLIRENASSRQSAMAPT
jgi:hypothetical protein